MKKKLIFGIAVFLLFIIFAFWLFEARLYPIIEKLAVTKSKNLALVTVNSAILDCMEGVGDFVKIERDADGQTVLLETNSETVNLLKARISVEVEKRLSSLDEEIKIPLGNVTGIKLFSGRGPKISVKTTPARSVSTRVESVFSSCGINQTRHLVTLAVETDFGVILLSRSVECHVSDTVTLADTVIVGKVPDAYTDINKIGDDFLGDVVDFSAQLAE